MNSSHNQVVTTPNGRLLGGAKKIMQRLGSPVERVLLRGKSFLIKRDDLFYLSGNKFRKLFWLVQKDQEYFQEKVIMSYGGVQSNAMLAIAQLCRLKRVPFTYITRPLPKSLKTEALGNYKEALKLGMDHREISMKEYQDVVATLGGRLGFKLLNQEQLNPIVIPQGVACKEAEVGIAHLANEIDEYKKKEGLSDEKMVVVLPAGTGTTAFYLAQHVDFQYTTVMCIPCVGNKVYLQKQFANLASTTTKKVQFPHILSPKHQVPFGQPSLEYLNMYKELLDITGIEFDLLYATTTWITLFQNLEVLKEYKHIMYIHCGGVSGNSSQLKRYERMIT